MLKLFLITIFLLCWNTGRSQDNFANETEALKAASTLTRQNTGAAKITLLLKLSNWYISKSNRTANDERISHAYADKALAASNEINDLEKKAESYLQLSKVAQEQKEYEKGKGYADEAVRLYTGSTKYNQLGESYVMMWSLRSLLGLAYPERIPYLQKGAEAFEKADNKVRAADCLREMGDLYQISGDFAHALISLKKALDYYKAASYPRLQSVYDLLGTVHVMLGDYQEGISYGLMAIKTSVALNDTSLSLCTYHNRVGLAYMESYDTVHAVIHLKKAYDIAHFYHSMEIIYPMCSLATVYGTRDARSALNFIFKTEKENPDLDIQSSPYIQGSLITFYRKLKEYDKAMPYCRMLEKGLEAYNYDYRMRAISFRWLIQYYIETGNRKKVEELVALHKRFSSEINTAQVHINNEFFQFKADSLKGDFASALKHFQSYKLLLDTIFTQKKVSQVNQLNVLYETEKKDKDIALLTKESILQTSVLKQATMMKNIMLAGLAFALLITGLLWYGYRLKQRSNKNLQLHQLEIGSKNRQLEKLVEEKEWLVKEIHHRVKNNLHMVIGLLASQSEFLKTREALDAMTESQQRIQAMSLIHQKLYQSENLSTIDMPSYILELVQYLQSSFDRKLPIRFSLDIAKAEFPLSHSIPLGLILNEAITNAIKYAFPGNAEGEIKIWLRETAGASFSLGIEDNGVGFSPGFDPKKSSSLGLLLMQGLTDDINGKLSITSAGGIRIEVLFDVPEININKER